MNTPTTSTEREYVEAILRRMTDLNCWHASFIEELSPALSLALGEKRARLRPLLHASLDSELGQFEGEMNLFISCPWRLRTVNQILCASHDSDSKQVHFAIAQLLNSLVQNVVIGSFPWDLHISFSNGLILESFSALDLTIEPRMKSDISIRYDMRRLALGPGTHVQDDIR